MCLLLLKLFWTYNGLHPIFTYIPFKVQMLLTLWKPYVMFPLNPMALLLQLSLLWQCHLWYLLPLLLNCLSCGNVIYGTARVCLTTCTTNGTTLTIVGTIYGSTLPLIIFCALKSMLSCSLFIPELEALPSSTLFFLLRKLLGEFITTFFLFFSVVYISSLVFLTLADGFYGLSF